MARSKASALKLMSVGSHFTLSQVNQIHNAHLAKNEAQLRTLLNSNPSVTTKSVFAKSRIVSQYHNMVQKPTKNEIGWFKKKYGVDIGIDPKVDLKAVKKIAQKDRSIRLKAKIASRKAKKAQRTIPSPKKKRPFKGKGGAVIIRPKGKTPKVKVLPPTQEPTKGLYPTLRNKDPLKKPSQQKFPIITPRGFFTLNHNRYYQIGKMDPDSLDMNSLIRATGLNRGERHYLSIHGMNVMRFFVKFKDPEGHDIIVSTPVFSVGNAEIIRSFLRKMRPGNSIHGYTSTKYYEKEEEDDPNRSIEISQIVEIWANYYYD